MTTPWVCLANDKKYLAPANVNRSKMWRILNPIISNDVVVFDGNDKHDLYFDVFTRQKWTVIAFFLLFGPVK